MLHRLLLSGLIAIGVAAAAMPSARAQRFTEAAAAGAIGDANSLSSRIRAYHRGPGRWTGLTPVPASYCPTMRAGEAVLKEPSRPARRAILYFPAGFELPRARAGRAPSHRR